MTNADAFRKLRAAWFHRVLEAHPHEREWEDDSAEASRRRNNRELRTLFDAQTEQIIIGSVPTPPIAPTCAADMQRKHDEGTPLSRL